MNLTQDYKLTNLYKIRHSLSHIMAQAVLEKFPDGKIAIGPPIENGFYYDFELPRTLVPDDLIWIEKRMREIIQSSFQFSKKVVTGDEARDLFQDQPFKIELINGLENGNVDEYGEPIDAKIEISTYTHDGFTDLCAGPHVANSKEINPDAFKLLRIAGAYWRGDENNPQLQRIYGTAWETVDEFQKYLWFLEESEKRDHRKLGKRLELFHFDQTAPGIPYWLPKGLIVLNELIAFWRKEHTERGYQEIASPLINDRKLYEISGHWDHYKENMFIVPIDEKTTYSLKPMNCPNAMVVFNLKTRSHKDLPLRLSDCDHLHRYEKSGVLHGLLRVRAFQQDDAHVFVTENQIESEFENILRIAEKFYKIFDLEFSLSLGTRPEKFLGSIETWNKAEKALTRILEGRVGKGNFSIKEGDGAFYGPKIDIMMKDALGREWQMGTVQLDFQLPERFKCKYIDENGKKVTPIVIHRVIYGSLERFIGILIEHTIGALPIWLSPIQVRVIPVTDSQMDYAEEIRDQLLKASIRADISNTSERMNALVRDAQLEKIPYMAIVGKKEVSDRSVSVRLRNGNNLGKLALDDFASLVSSAITSKALDPLSSNESNT